MLCAVSGARPDEGLGLYKEGVDKQKSNVIASILEDFVDYGHVEEVQSLVDEVLESHFEEVSDILNASSSSVSKEDVAKADDIIRTSTSYHQSIVEYFMYENGPAIWKKRFGPRGPHHYTRHRVPQAPLTDLEAQLAKGKVDAKGRGKKVAVEELTMKNAGDLQVNNYNAHREGKNACIRLLRAKLIEYKLTWSDSAKQKVQDAIIKYWHDKMTERHEALQFDFSAAFLKQ
ncbi:hypothetical protein MMC27_001521 [Xylographa pallens]|nr:hypothetical protein [Xylographa pallens]